MKHFQIPLTIFLRRKQNLNVQRLPIQKSNNEATPDYESHPPLSDLPHAIFLTLLQQPHLLTHQIVYLLGEVVLLEEVYVSAAFFDYVVIELLKRPSN